MSPESWGWWSVAATTSVLPALHDDSVVLGALLGCADLDDDGRAGRARVERRRVLHHLSDAAVRARRLADARAEEGVGREGQHHC